MSATTLELPVATSAWLDWAMKELAAVDLGDARLNRRAAKIAAMFLSWPTTSIPKATGSWPGAKAAYRLFDNPEFTDKVPEMKTPRGQAGAVLASSAWSRVAAPIFTSQVSFHG